MCKWRRLGFLRPVFPVGLAILAVLAIGLGGDGVYALDEVEPAATVKATPRSPAATARYEVTFTASHELRPSRDGIVMTLDEDVGVPRFIPPPAVQVRFQKEDGDPIGSGRGTAVAVELDNQDDPRRDTTLTIYPAIRGSGSDAPPQAIPANAEVTVIFTKQAGLSNPTEGGTYSWRVSTTKDPTPQPAAHPDPEVRQAFGEAEGLTTPDNTQEDIVTGLLVDWEVQLSHEGVRRGDEVTVIGRGYKNGTTLTFWRDANFDGRRDSGENELCRVEVGGNDIGTCSFLVSNPPFVAGFGECALESSRRRGRRLQLRQRGGRPEPTLNPGPRYRDNRDRGSEQCVEEADQVLELEGGVLVGPGISPGRTILVQLTDFPPGELTAVDIGGVPADLDDLRDKTVPDSGSFHFSLDLPNGARLGRQSLRVVVTRQDDGKEFEARATVGVGR